MICAAIAVLLSQLAVLDLTPAELGAAQAGKVPTRSETIISARGKAAGRGWGAIIIERPLAAVWATLSHYEDRADYIPRLERVTVLTRERGRLRVRQEVDASVTTIRYTAWCELDEEARAIRWKLDRTAPDNSVADVEGDYRMAALSSTRTLLVYRTYVDTGLKVPRFIQAYMQRRSLPDLLRSIKRRVESGGTWKKP